MDTALTRSQLAFSLIVGAGIVAGLIQLIDYPWVLDQLFVTFMLTIWLFEGAIGAKGRLERGQMGRFMAFIWSPGVFVVLALDVVFNATWGWIIFRERPRWEDREFLFSARVQRHVDQAATWTGMPRHQKKAAYVWARRFNRIDPGHIRNVPERVDELIDWL